MTRLISVDDAAYTFHLHRSTIFRALKSGQLRRYEALGNRQTMVDREEVQRLVRPASLSEAEVKKAALAAVQAVAEGSTPDHYLGQELVELIKAFLSHYDLEPGADFVSSAQAGVLYARNGSDAIERAVLGLTGNAVDRNGNKEQWSYSLYVDLASDLSELVPGSSKGIASTARWQLTTG